jgi:hypothetical protein
MKFDALHGQNSRTLLEIAATPVNSALECSCPLPLLPKSRF